VIGFIGSFYHFEGLDCLIRAMPLVLAALPTARLVLVGTGEAEMAIRDRVQSLGLADAVTLTGRVPHADVLRYYSIMDVLVYPRRSERVTELVTPLKPLEALAVGKPVVGSDVGGIAELLDDGKVGRLFKAGDAADLANVLLAVLGNPALREEMRASGRRFVLERRQWSSLAAEYLPIYERLTARAA
jgi:glycosyltransferase involved in cell wall biosynthesis